MRCKKTTPEVARILGLTHGYLLKYLSRYPEVRPAESVTGAWFWSEEEIERLIAFRAGKRQRKK